ncbi:MAG TPA: VOC family protein [Myxococcales bacterium]
MLRLRWALVVASCSVIAHCAAARAEGAALVRAVGCIGLTVSDLDRSVAFYSGVLSFEKALQVDQAGQALERLQGVSTAPQRLPDWNPAAGGIRAFYFRDPDRHALEVLQLPAGKGDPKWQRKERLFLGIDHTAIVVSDTEASLQFYRDALGLRVAGASENWGAEQERLNDVEGAHLRITTLRAASGPGIEFLEYLAPGGGRLFPADERANDLVHWQTTVVADPAEGARVLRAHGSPFVSPGVVRLSDRRLGYRRAVLARDPDGHVLQLAGE